MAKTVADILEGKGRQVVGIAPERSVGDAVRLLVARNIGALVVLDDEDAIAGIITERDVLRECARRPAELDRVRVSEVMTRAVLTGSLADTLPYVQQVMTERRIRHLPILEDGRLAGMVSIGDVVKALLELSTEEADSLRDMLAGHYVVT